MVFLPLWQLNRGFVGILSTDKGCGSGCNLAGDVEGVLRFKQVSEVMTQIVLLTTKL